MRLEKKNIHMNKIVKRETVIFFVSREERIMDADNEIENIINQKEIVTTDGVVTRENQITVNGTINYNILYYPKNSEMVCGEEKEINFEYTNQYLKDCVEDLLLILRKYSRDFCVLPIEPFIASKLTPLSCTIWKIDPIAATTQSFE